jgi:microcompartment protein CcmK/EutM
VNIARVIGSTISTVKDPKVRSVKLLLCQPANVAGEAKGTAYVAIDLVDAGVDDLVLTCHGSAARQTFLTKDAPVDAVIMAVVDELEMDGQVVFQK